MDDDLDLSEYLRIAKARWPWTLLGFLIVMWLACTYAFMSAPVYEARSLVAISNQDQANFLLGSSAPKTADLETQRIIIQSPSITSPLYAKYGEESFTLATSILKNSNIIEIVVEAGSPEDAAGIASGITTRYINYTAQARIQDAENNIAFITERIAAYDAEIDKLDRERTEYESDALAPLTRKEEIQYQSLQRQLAAKTKLYDYLLTKREEAELTASMENANVKVVSYPEVPLTPIRPNKPLIIALGVVLAFGGAIVAATIADGIAQDRKKRK